MKKKNKEIYNIILRYLIILLIALPNLYLFYLIFTPLTVYPVYFLLNLFFDVSLKGNVIQIPNYAIEIIKACVAGSAYYFLFILNLSIPKIKILKRIKMITLSFAVLLVINILRIFFLVLILDSKFFDVTHILFWNLLSTVFVLGIWFTEVKIFKIKKIPIYSDLKFLYKKSILK